MGRRIWIAVLAATIGGVFAVIPLAASGGSGGHVMIAERNIFGKCIRVEP